jgi:predicted nucleic acid-binding Zn ribbon protein
LIQKVNDPPLPACPSCGGPVAKLLSPPGLQFKGSGWYITDYARKGKTDGAGTKTTESEKSSTGKSEAAKTESKKESG